MELTAAQVDELRELIYCPGVPATVGTRARIVLWFTENRSKKEIAAMAGVSRPTVNLWLSRYADEGVSGLLERKRGAGREQVPGSVRATILAATRSAPPDGLSHWSAREMAKFIERTEKGRFREVRGSWRGRVELESAEVEVDRGLEVFAVAVAVG